MIVLENKTIKDKFNQAEKYINRHIGTWQRWLSSWQDEIGKYRDLKDIVFKISNWLKTKNIGNNFWTSAPHHVDTSLIEIAARLNNIRTLFSITKRFLQVIIYPCIGRNLNLTIS